MTFASTSLYLLIFGLLSLLDLCNSSSDLLRDPPKLSKDEKKFTHLIPETVEYVLRTGGTGQWTHMFNWSSIEKPHCYTGRWKAAPIKHRLFTEKNIEILKDKGTYENDIVKYVFPNDKKRKTERVTMLKCSCSINDTGGIKQNYPNSIDDGVNPDFPPTSGDKNDKSTNFKPSDTTGKNDYGNVALKANITSTSPGHEGTPKESPSVDTARVGIITDKQSSNKSTEGQGFELFRRSPPEPEVELEYDFAFAVPAYSICVDDGTGKRFTYLSKGLYGGNSFFVYAKDGGVLHAIAYLAVDP